SISQKIKKILGKELISREAELSEKRKQLTTYRKENELLGFGTDKKSTIIERLLQLSDAMTKAEMERISARAAYEPLVETIKTQDDVIRVINMEHGFPKEGPAYDEIKAFQDELRELEMRREELLQTCTASHPSIQAIQKQMDYLFGRRKTKINDVVRAQLENLRQNYISAQKRYRDLVLLLQQQKKLARELNSKTAKYAMLESEVKRIEQICDHVYTQIKGIYVAADAGSLNIQILETGEPANRPSSPK
ncbi:unnamed protein product, partial [marine sediment metagenome]